MAKVLERKLGSYINIATLVSLIATVLTIYFFVGALNRNAIRTDTQLLTAGIAAAAEQNEVWTVDYSWWDGITTLFRSGNTYWLHDGLTDSFDDHNGFDFVILTEEEAGRVYGWHRDGSAKPRTNLLSETDVTALRRDLVINHENGRFSASHMLQFDGRPYLASATIIGEYDNRAAEIDPALDPMMIIGTEIDQTFLNTLEANYLIDNIRFIPTREIAIEGAVPVHDRSGHSVGQLVWTPSQPGLQALRLALIPLFLFILAFAVGSRILGRRVKQLARNADESRMRARNAARTDSLSKIPNRRAFMEIVEADDAVKSARKGHAAVIYIDLNGFKEINDKAGHHAGDEVIKIVAERLTNTAPEDVLIARMGGDEFACALIGREQTKSTLELARQISHNLNQPVVIGDQQFEIGGAVGVANSHVNAPQTFVELVQDADAAMYRAKAEQLDQPLTYDISFGMEASQRRELETDMERGLENGEFYVLYQPIVKAADSTIVSVEALLRWEHETLGTVPPDVFIPIAERSRLINRLGDLVLDSICADFGPQTAHTVSMNVSPIQLNDSDLADRFADKLAQHDMSPSMIEIELTETVLVDNFDKAKSRLEELNRAGFRINLDDFGTGFASMGYSKTLPFSKIKIDKSFIGVIGKDDGHNKLLQALSLMGDALKLSVVAEGVETASQANMLRLLGFDYLQGWHFGRPMTSKAIGELIATPPQDDLADDTPEAGSSRT